MIFTLACKNKNKTTPDLVIKKDSLQIKPDTFNTQDLDRYPSLQSDIPLDTINIPANKKHKVFTIAYPKISSKDYPLVNMEINKLIKSKEKIFYDMVKDDKVEYDSLMEDYVGWGMMIRPKSLYQNKKKISFSIETIEGYTGASAGVEYNVLNFNIDKKKQISLKDYFLLNTLSDTIYLEKIIGRAINREFSIKKYVGDGEEHINFSFDDAYIYLYFDKYDPLTWGISSIKKKYILDHINPEYR